MLTERQKNILMDRTFDAACLNVKGEVDWANQIIERLKGNYNGIEDYVNQMYEFYVNMVSTNNTFLSRADYMIEHKDTLKLMYR